MVIQSRRRVKKNGRRSLVLFMALLSIAAIVGGAVLYRQEIKGFASNMFSGLDKTANAKKKVRGTIYDRNFKELAVTLDRVSVYVRPRELGDVRGNAGQLANVLGMNEQELLERLDTESQRVWLAKDISQEEEQAVADLHLSGVFLHREQVRYYPQKSVAAHVIGFADQTMGLAGAEHYYNRLLDQPSINHKDFPHVDFGDKLSTGTSGQHLVLTIDLKIQDLLEKYVATLGAAHAGMEIAALLMETGTGAIVANANFPSFDPNIFYQYKNESFNNVLFAPVVIPPVIQGFFQDAALIQAGVDRYDQVYPWSISAGAADFGAGYRSGGLTELSVVPELDFSLQDGNGNIAMSASGSKKNPAVSAGATGDIPLKATPIQILLAMNNLLGSNSNGEHRVSPHVLDRVLERNGECEYPYRLLTTGDGKRRFDVAGVKVSVEATAEQGGSSVAGARDEAEATAEQGGSSVEGAGTAQKRPQNREVQVSRAPGTAQKRPQKVVAAGGRQHSRRRKCGD